MASAPPPHLLLLLPTAADSDWPSCCCCRLLRLLLGPVPLASRTPIRLRNPSPALHPTPSHPPPFLLLPPTPYLHQPEVGVPHACSRTSSAEGLMQAGLNLLPPTWGSSDNLKACFVCSTHCPEPLPTGLQRMCTWVETAQWSGDG